MTAVSAGLLRLVTAGLVCGFALSLGGKGPQREILRFGCACLMLVLLLSLIRGIDPGSFGINGCQRELEDVVAQAQRETRQKLLEETERQLAAELDQRAAELGLDCRAEVDCGADEDGLVTVEQVRIAYCSGPREALSQLRQRVSALLQMSDTQIIICEEECP